MQNINTKEYWDNRFLSNWKGAGEQQSTEYAKANVKNISLPQNFKGTILDFGCAMGDSMPVYKNAFPLAKLIGMDISVTAITACKEKYRDLAHFLVGTIEDVPEVDIIIVSHVLEHISNDKQVVKQLLLKSHQLFIFVPFKENPLYIEHVNCYDENYYNDLNILDRKIFAIEYFQPISLIQFIKNILKLKIKFKTKFSKDIIMFHLMGINADQSKQ